jgi:CCR4-NOT transcription complex subunit 7/8
MANPSFMNPNNAINPFAVSGNALSLAGGFGGGGGIGVGGGTGLASHAAQMSFAHGGLQQQGHSGMGEQGGRAAANKGRIRDVWKHNLHEEMEHLRRLVDKYPYIAMVSMGWLDGIIMVD